MVKGKKLVSAVLATFCITILLCMLTSMSAPSIDRYNPWADINNDGTVDIYDAILLANAFNSNGEKITKLAVAYDSGWVNLTGQTSMEHTLVHNLGLNSIDVIVDARERIPGWESVYGGFLWPHGWNDQKLESIIQTSDGGYACAGYGYFGGEYDEDLWLTKTDGDGVQSWNTSFGGSGNERGYCVVQTSDGGYACAGVTNSFTGYGNGFLFLKTSTSGAAEWYSKFGGEFSDAEAHSLIQTKDGYLMAGQSNSYGPNGIDCWLVKTDVNGTAQWNKTYGGTGSDGANCIISTSDGGCAIAGFTTSYGPGDSDFWLMKIDSSDNANWNKTYGGAMDDAAYSVVQTDDGGYALAGYTFSYGAGGGDFWLVKTDSGGNMQWNKTYGGTTLDQAYSLVKDRMGGYAVAGYTGSFGQGGDVWLVKTGENGSIEWNRTFGSGNMEAAYSLIQTSDGAYALAGETHSFGPGDSDGYIVRTDSECGLFWKDLNASTITVCRDATHPSWYLLRVQIAEGKS